MLWSIAWPSEEGGEIPGYAPDSENNVLIVSQVIDAETEDAAKQAFAARVDAFNANLLKASLDIERYNAALPYLISIWTELRLDGYPVTPTGMEDSVAAGRLGVITATLEILVAKGNLTFIEEIDPSTGELRKRYFHRNHAPKAN